MDKDVSTTKHGGNKYGQNAGKYIRMTALVIALCTVIALFTLPVIFYYLSVSQSVYLQCIINVHEGV